MKPVLISVLEMKTGQGQKIIKHVLIKFTVKIKYFLSLNFRKICSQSKGLVSVNKFF
jgi:hypothetical protein